MNPNKTTLHQILVAFHSNARKANSVQKSRGEVHHSTRKLWRQKGTGKARVGMSSSPIRRGGGRAFPNTGKESYRLKINRKMFRLTTKLLIEMLIGSGRMNVIEGLQLEFGKTKHFMRVIRGKLSILRGLLIVENTEMNQQLYLASRNSVDFNVMISSNINLTALLTYEHSFITIGAFNSLRKSFITGSSDEES